MWKLFGLCALGAVAAFACGKTPTSRTLDAESASGSSAIAAVDAGAPGTSAGPFEGTMGDALRDLPGGGQLNGAGVLGDGGAIGIWTARNEVASG